MPGLTDLPIESVIPAIREALQSQTQLLVEAAPGAGKSTIVPIRLLQESWLAGQKVLLLEPRRLAARAVARRMAQLLGESVGETVGYRMRLDNCISAKTRLEVITEGVLTRQLQNDPELSGIGCVIFDEFHERSLQADLGLALTLDCQNGLREDLRLIVMSATLDSAAMLRVMPQAVSVVSEGRVFPVETIYQGGFQRRELVSAVARSTLKALQEQDGNALVFLPGKGEILSLQKLLQAQLDADIEVTPLYGGLDSAAQDRAIQLPAAGKRKCVLATNVAETSLTIEGISMVIDSGIERRMSFNPRTGMSGLVTVEASQASVDQRRGRAGRLGPGICYRMWSESASRLAFAPPEIEIADLADLLLQLRAWGVTEVGQLNWVSLPPSAHLAQAQSLLESFTAINDSGGLTAHGQQLSALPLHPRIGNMLLQAKSLGSGRLACDIAALSAERNPYPDTAAERDFSIRLRFYQQGAKTRFSFAVKQIKKHSQQLQRQLKLSSDDSAVPEAVLLAMAYPDRIAMRRTGNEARYKLSSGQGATFIDSENAVAQAEFIVVTELDGREREARIYSAAVLEKKDLEHYLETLLYSAEQVEWDDTKNAVRAARQLKLGELVLEEKALKKPDQTECAKALLQGVRRRGLDCLPWAIACRNWLARIRFLAALPGEEKNWPDYSEQWLSENLEEWLQPWLEGKTRLSHLDSLDLKSILTANMNWEQQQLLEKMAPVTFTVPSGSFIRINYTDFNEPVLPVKLQEMFSCGIHPAIANGALPLLVHLLSPAQRPVQITRDLPGFWQGSYEAVRKEMKGRYPKHQWPEDPVNTEPHRGARGNKKKF